MTGRNVKPLQRRHSTTPSALVGSILELQAPSSLTLTFMMSQPATGATVCSSAIQCRRDVDRRNLLFSRLLRSDIQLGKPDCRNRDRAQLNQRAVVDRGVRATEDLQHHHTSVRLGSGRVSCRLPERNRREANRWTWCII